MHICTNFTRQLQHCQTFFFLFFFLRPHLLAVFLRVKIVFERPVSFCLHCFVFHLACSCITFVTIMHEKEHDTTKYFQPTEYQVTLRHTPHPQHPKTTMFYTKCLGLTQPNGNTLPHCRMTHYWEKLQTRNTQTERRPKAG